MYSLKNHARTNTFKFSFFNSIYRGHKDTLYHCLATTIASFKKGVREF